MNNFFLLDAALFVTLKVDLICIKSWKSSLIVVVDVDSSFCCSSSFATADKIQYVLQFDPNEPNNVNYVQDSGKTEKKLITKMEKYALSFNEALGLNINIIEFGVNSDTIYATNLFNPVPKIDINSVGERLFEWFVDNSVNLAVNRAKKVKLNT